MNGILNSFDEALHSEIHQSMSDADPRRLLENLRLQIFSKVRAEIGDIYGTVADVGCGSGYLSIWLALNQPQVEVVEAIEASQVAVDEVIPRNARFHNVGRKVLAKRGSFDELETARYDFVFAMGALHHSRNLGKTLRSISNGLKPGGYLVAQEPAMPDRTTHREYHFKYNIVEHRFGLRVRNGDRFDRFFRECEYKSAIVRAGMDIVLWADFLNQPARQNKLEKLVAYAARNGMRSTFRKVVGRISQSDQPTADKIPEWKKQMAEATKAVRPKLLIARKSDLEIIYHDS